MFLSPFKGKGQGGSRCFHLWSNAAGSRMCREPSQHSSKLWEVHFGALWNAYLRMIKWGMCLCEPAFTWKSLNWAKGPFSLVLWELSFRSSLGSSSGRTSQAVLCNLLHATRYANMHIPQEPHINDFCGASMLSCSVGHFNVWCNSWHETVLYAPGSLLSSCSLSPLQQETSLCILMKQGIQLQTAQHSPKWCHGLFSNLESTQFCFFLFIDQSDHCRIGKSFLCKEAWMQFHSDSIACFLQNKFDQVFPKLALLCYVSGLASHIRTAFDWNVSGF